MQTTLLWFRQDLRLKDNPALQAAIQTGQPLIPLYIYDTSSAWSAGAASQWWLHHSLHDLQQSLQKRQADLLILRGQSLDLLVKLCQKLNVSHVFWNRCYEPDSIKRDQAIKKRLRQDQLEVQSFNSNLLIEPWHCRKKDGTPYRVFTAFWKSMQKHRINFAQQPAPKKIPAAPKTTLVSASMTINQLNLLPNIHWDTGIKKTWRPGESNAIRTLNKFIDKALKYYPNERDIPKLLATSQLAPYLRFGEISPWRIWTLIENWCTTNTESGSVNAAEVYLRQLGWREFAYHLLYYFPQTSDAPLDQRFIHFPWKKNYSKQLKAWQTGNTGIPIVDAGMRELWHTGWMHNRVRMISASLLTKNLLIPWQEGAKWFWDTLVDADLANNTLGWQWSAGCGADAAPFFRIFNPIRQGERFDASGEYVRQWLPVLALLPDKWLHQPWLAPKQILNNANIRLGENYPKPITDLATSRKRALAAWQSIKNKRD